MMEMQEIKERKRATPVNGDTDVDEVDANVEPTASFLGRPQRRRSKIEDMVSYVTDRLWSAAFFGLAAFGLHEVQFYHEVLYARHANRSFVNLFIFCSTLVVLFGSYIEVYRNLYLGEKVNYEKAKTSTHGMLVSMVLAGACFTVGMWPVWHWLTIPYLFMWFWGFIVQIVMLFPIQLQRVIFGVGYLWFMHSYLSLFVV